MGGIFGVVSKEDCVKELFYGTDYHSHLGTRRGGLAVLNRRGFTRFIHNIENSQFRSKFEDDIEKMTGKMGIGCISDTEDQPLIISSHLGNYAIVTVGRINNVRELVKRTFAKRASHFSEMSGGGVNPTELVATLISQGETFVKGIQYAQEVIEGSCSLLLLTGDGIYAARDRLGRTPLVIGEKEDAHCVSIERSAFPNLGYQLAKELGPGEIALLRSEGVEQKTPPGDVLRICAFLWVYYGYPASRYEGINVEIVRNRSGAVLAQRNTVDVDMVAGIPDSGTPYAVGYANESTIPYCRPFVKYTPTWPRSFMPHNHAIRKLVARMKLIPIRELIEGQRLLFCEDSIVRGTQLNETVQRLYDYGAREVHMRPACPPLLYSCRFLNFSQSRSELELAARRAIRVIEDKDDISLEPYTSSDTDKYRSMVEQIRREMNFTSLSYQTMSDMIEAIGLGKESVCTYCWDGQG
ncbi:MAG: amidophosphoribosyltransferase [Deltaproteobacteria bacterium]|nr:amidophosphoribosyltransferase [Deltaproteobacteria bacterium]